MALTFREFVNIIASAQFLGKYVEMRNRRDDKHYRFKGQFIMRFYSALTYGTFYSCKVKMFLEIPQIENQA